MIITLPHSTQATFLVLMKPISFFVFFGSPSLDTESFFFCRFVNELIRRKRGFAQLGTNNNNKRGKSHPLLYVHADFQFVLAQCWTRTERVPPLSTCYGPGISSRFFSAIFSFSLLFLPPSLVIFLHFGITEAEPRSGGIPEFSLSLSLSLYQAVCVCVREPPG